MAAWTKSVTNTQSSPEAAWLSNRADKGSEDDKGRIPYSLTFHPRVGSWSLIPVLLFFKVINGPSLFGIEGFSGAWGFQ